MRKLLLMLALMLPCLGVWAQTPVLTYENITAPQELSATDVATIRGFQNGITIVADVEITNTATGNPPSVLFAAVADYTSSSTANNSVWSLGFGGNQMRFIVGPRDGGWYSRGSIGTSATKIIYTNKGNSFNFYVDGIKTGELSVSNSSFTTFNGENAKFYLGGLVYNTSTQWGNFNGTISKVEIYDGVLTADQIVGFYCPENAVTDYTKFVHGNVYTFQTKRGWLMAKEGTDFVYSSGKLNDVIPAEDNANCQWVYYATEKGKYLYNVAVGKFISFDSTNLNRIALSDTPTTSAIEFKNSTIAAYPILIGVESKVINQNLTNNTFTYGALLWGDGWTGYHGDEGSATLALSQGEATADILNALNEKVGRFEVMSELQYMYENTKSSTEEKIGEYEYEKWWYLNYLINTPEADIKLVDLQNFVITYRNSLIKPSAGKFLRIKAVAGWNDDAPYLGAKNTTTNGKDTRAEYVAGDDANTIFYFNGSNLVSFGSGNYLVSNNDFLGYKGVQTSGTNFGFEVASNNLLGAYNISFNDGNRWLYCNKDNYTDAGGRGTQNGYCFNLEEVTEIPVTISVAKYASFYAPVAMILPAEVKAYYIAEKKVANDITYVVLSEIENVIPANTGVLLYSETAGTYNLTVGREATTNTSENWLTGSVPSSYVTADSYVLSMKNSLVGFYFTEKDQQGNSAWLNHGFKAYLPAEHIDQNAGAIRFIFGGETTAIESVLNNGVDANAPIYDLSGRRVVNAVKGGIYIQNGKKFIVK